MTLDDRRDGDTRAVLASLAAHDVSPHRTRQLRRRCHAVLQPQPPADTSTAVRKDETLVRIVAPALGGAWCLAYLVEIVRRAAVYFSAQ